MHEVEKEIFLGTLVLVDDAEGYSFLAKLLLKELGTEMGEIHFVHLPRPSTLMPYLNNPANPKPDLILMDINMPECDGLTLLKKLRQEDSIRVPVGIMSDELTISNVRLAYELGANFCLNKPDSLEKFKTVFRDILHFWFEVAARPA